MLQNDTDPVRSRPENGTAGKKPDKQTDAELKRIEEEGLFMPVSMRLPVILSLFTLWIRKRNVTASSALPRTIWRPLPRQRKE